MLAHTVIRAFLQRVCQQPCRGAPGNLNRRLVDRTRREGKAEQSAMRFFRSKKEAFAVDFTKDQGYEGYRWKVLSISFFLTVRHDWGSLQIGTQRLAE